MDPSNPLAAPRETRRFVRRILRAYADAELTMLIHLGHVTGLWSTLTDGPGTSRQIARRSHQDERYVREWLHGVAAARIVAYDARTRRFSLAPARARALSGPSIYNMAPGSLMIHLGAKNLERVAAAFTTGEGVPYSAYLPEFPRIMEEMNRRRVEALLVSGYVPLLPGLSEALARGIRGADFGTGSGHVLHRLAQAFPRSRFLGFDRAAAPLARARAQAKSLGLGNVRFVRTDASGLRRFGPFDLITMFDAIHDLGRPEATVRSVVRALRPGGWFLAQEPRASSVLLDNIGRTGARFLYGVSVTYCLPVSRSDGPGGLGTCWGEQRAKALLRRSGLTGLRVHEAPGNALALVFTGRRPLSPRRSR